MGAKTLTKASITAKAAAMGVPMVIAIADESGVLKAFNRMDGAPLLSVDLAKDKAYTAAAYGIAPHVWYDFIKDDPPLLHGIVKTPRLIVFGGGYPIEVDGAVVGAIGVGFGIALMVWPEAGVALVGLLLGIGALIAGIGELITAFGPRKIAHPA